MRFVWLFLVILAGLHWLLALFLSGSLPGNYWLAVIVNNILTIPAMLTIVGFPVLLGIVAVVIIVAIWKELKYRRIPWQWLKNLLLIPLLIFALFPAFVSYDPGSSLTVQPWGKVYHIAYSALYFDDNYGSLFLYECDRTGFWCWNIHRFDTSVGMIEIFKFTYNAQTNLLSLGSDGDSQAIYLRSQNKVICPLNKNSSLNTSCQKA
ncbi:hypothetical protein [Calothrix sp. 336/3]|uniref:hypothetical protein n=1 Tax=Calothrix sp. 336/3 TaxID=1337936 RepID=UPI0004E42832|nr:hypothetical protein [Calothrix sp. 336/3]AKG20933.1 hypothetical protein IJ00_06145 [Calothrix sp. 336/3]